MSPRRVVLGATALLALAACSTESADSTVEVTGTDDACIIAQDVVEAGKIGFEFTNESGKVNELYVLKANGDTLGEVENVTTGTSRTLTVDLVAGDHLVRCKPGQSGDGFESAFTVTGDGGSAQAEPDREVAFDAVDFGYENLDLTGIADGDTIRFVMDNAGEQAHEFEVLDPDGEPIGEVAATNPGESGGATMTFTAPGVYTYQCILVDPDSAKPHTELGMIGTFDVAEG
ncbi:MAG TPA: cupredoxin domain-containing protein [Ilumatobacteraceae bacterium]|jgi:plastocyanin|nr:cupredoxin domain-containing protein [Ilumatobacteraceae bacterium]